MPPCRRGRLPQHIQKGIAAMFDKKKNSTESYGVIGLGRFGTALVKTLAAAGKEVIAVDKDEAKVKASAAATPITPLSSMSWTKYH